MLRAIVDLVDVVFFRKLFSFDCIGRTGIKIFTSSLNHENRSGEWNVKRNMCSLVETYHVEQKSTKKSTLSERYQSKLRFLDQFLV